MIIDAIKCSRELALMHQTQGSPIQYSYDFALSCVGLENVISPDMKERFKDREDAKKFQPSTVLAEQSRQMTRLASSPVDLAYVSHMSSKELN